MSNENGGQVFSVFGLKNATSYRLKSSLAWFTSADWSSGSYLGRRAARCVSWPARVRADSRAGSSLSRRSRNGRGSPPGWCCCSRAPPRCPSSDWGRGRPKRLKQWMKWNSFWDQYAVTLVTFGWGGGGVAGTRGLILPFHRFHAESGRAAVSECCFYVLVLFFCDSDCTLLTQPSHNGPHSQLREHLRRLAANVSPLSPAWGDGINQQAADVF